MTPRTDMFINYQLIFKPRPGNSNFRAFQLLASTFGFFLTELPLMASFQLMVDHLSIQSVSVLQKYQTVMLLHVAKEWKPKKGVVFKVTHAVIGEVLLWPLTWMAL